MTGVLFPAKAVFSLCHMHTGSGASDEDFNFLLTHFITLVAVDSACVKSQRDPFVICITDHNCVIFCHSISHNYFF